MKKYIRYNFNYGDNDPNKMCIVVPDEQSAREYVDIWQYVDDNHMSVEFLESHPLIYLN